MAAFARLKGFELIELGLSDKAIGLNSPLFKRPPRRESMVAAMS